ncbi:MAG: hypothetical protein KGL35_05220 [Bradyrhizobium sp.]|nr:hypothetical protein [Bradyrhizobium sp.]
MTRALRQALGAGTSATAIAVRACPRVVYRGDPTATVKIMDLGTLEPMLIEIAPGGSVRQLWLYRGDYLRGAQMPPGEYPLRDSMELAGETLAVLGREVWSFPGRMQ